MGKNGVLLLLLMALPVRAERMGDITIVPLPTIEATSHRGYHEQRFQVVNQSQSNPHRVTVAMETQMFVRHGPNGNMRVTRTVVVPPKTALVVPLYQPLIMSQLATEAEVAIDGRTQTRKLNLSPTQPAYWNARTVLASRSFPVVALRSLLMPKPDPGPPSATPPIVPSTPSPVSVVVARGGPADWSTNWLAWSRVRGMAFTAEDWREMSPATQQALRDWLHAGGSLLLLGGQPFPGVRDVTEVGPLTVGRVGFGTIFLASDIDSLGEPARKEMAGLWFPHDRESPWGDTDVGGLLPVLPDRKLPIGGLFSVLVGFAVIAGPLNLIVLARKQRRVWVFWTVPLSGVLAALVILGYTMTAEGWHRAVRSTSLTLLDQESGEAATVGCFGIYSTLPADGRIHLGPATEAIPSRQLANQVELDWTDGQRLVSGWVPGRVSSHFLVRKAEPRRERVPISIEGGRVTALNGLGVPISRLLYAADDGRIYEGRDIAPGRKALLADTRLSVKKDASLSPLIAHTAGEWATLPDRVKTNAMSYLRAGTYIAVVDRSPFLERPLDKTTSEAAQSTIFGLVARSGASGS